MITGICVGVAFVAGLIAGCAFMVWVVKGLAGIEEAIEVGCKVV